VSTSIVNATTVLNQPSITRVFYSITVTCTIHPDSEADECEVIVIGGSMNRTGMYVYMYACMHVYIAINLSSNLCMYVCMDVAMYHRPTFRS